MQLTLAQHGFELGESTTLKNFFRSIPTMLLHSPRLAELLDAELQTLRANCKVMQGFLTGVVVEGSASDSYTVQESTVFFNGKCCLSGNKTRPIF